MDWSEKLANVKDQVMILDDLVSELGDIKGKIHNTEDVESFLTKYEKAFLFTDVLLGSAESLKNEAEEKNQEASCDKLIEDIVDAKSLIAFAYNENAASINKVMLSATAVIERDMKASQGLQLTVFSLVLTILAFVLNNSKILAVDDINLKNVLLVNVSFILATVVFFGLIYRFIFPMYFIKSDREDSQVGLDNKKSDKSNFKKLSSYLGSFFRGVRSGRSQWRTGATGH